MNAITHAIEKAKPTTPAGVVHVDLHDLMTQDWPAARFVLEPIIPRREVTLLAGHGGIGKSMLGLTLAAHAACGRQWGPFPAVQCPAVYFSLEDEAAIQDAAAMQRLRPDLSARITSGEVDIDDVRPDVWATFFELLQQREATS